MKRVDVGRRDEADELPGNDGCQASGSSARLRSGEDSKHTHTQVKFKSISAICKVKTDLTLLDDGIRVNTPKRAKNPVSNRLVGGID